MGRDTSRAQRPLPSSALAGPSSLPSALLQKDRACVINQSEAEFIPTQINGGLGSCVAPCSSCWLSEAVESSGDAQSGSTWSSGSPEPVYPRHIYFCSERGAVGSQRLFWSLYPAVHTRHLLQTWFSSDGLAPGGSLLFMRSANS